MTTAKKQGHASGQDKYAEAAFWDKVAGQRVYAAFDEDEYREVFTATLGTELAGTTVIDIGSASGVSAAILASYGANVVGIDISPDLIAQAKAMWKDYGDRIEFMVGDAEKLEVPDESVDACFFGGVLHHFPERERVYAEARRVLKPGGKFVAIEPNRLDVFERIEWAVADLRGKLAPSEYPIDPIAMKGELESAGFVEPSFTTIRHDIPVLAQIPMLRRRFNRQKGFGIKDPILRFVNAWRAPECRGTFFVIEATRPA